MFVDANVTVLDDVLPADLKDRIMEAVSWMPMYFLNRWERYKSHELDMHWYYPVVFSEDIYNGDIEAELMGLDEGLKPIAECWTQIKSGLAYPVRLYECSLSANTFGTEGRVHQDIADKARRADHFTVLVYCNKTWNIDWAGETIFFDDRNEITGAVMPKPGRVVMINNDPPHVGRSVSRTCPSDRRVLVFKYWRLAASV
jgi:SM-20-related protein